MMKRQSIMIGVFGLAFAWNTTHAGGPAATVKIKGIVKTETDQAAPNGFTVKARRKGADVSGAASPERSTGEFTLTISGISVGEEIGLVVDDPMAKAVAFQKGISGTLKLDDKAIASGLIDAGVLRVDLGPQEPVEAFAFGGRVNDAAGKPLPAGFVMHVSTERGERKTSEDIQDGKFALIFIDLQGEFPRINEGDRFKFSVKDKNGKEYSVEPAAYKLTRTDIANSSISTLEFRVKL
ncbi:MAG: hypothetical protein HY303_20675 [Candidatus Wallbacteria bacterium]|nr:hypothetical protein [Candidatus Wallbacteria bacterium]